MTQEAVFISKVVNGRPACGDAIRRALVALNGCLVKITIKKQVKGRSLSQNAYYWGVVIPAVVTILEEYGNDADSEMAHEVCKRLFMPREGMKHIKGKKSIMDMRSTRWLGTKGMEDYMEKIRAWAATEGQQIPLPNELTEEA